MDDTWNIPPILGEVFNLNCKIIYELKNKSSPIYYKINKIDKAYFTKSEKLGPSVLLFKFKDYGFYTIDWYVNNELKHSHKVTITDYKSKIIFVSCDKVEKDVKPSLWNKVKEEA